MAATTYRAAAIGRTGRGNWGHGLHLGFLGHGNIEVVAVADEDEGGRLKAQGELAAPRAYADYVQMLREQAPDIVSVGPRWPDCHLEMVLACIEAGAHVYCEKPMTWNLEEGDQIVAAADAAGKKVAVAHQGAYLPQVHRIKTALNTGCIGQVQQLRAHGKQDRRGGGEDMIVLGTHLFNMMRFFVGDVAWISAHVMAEGRELEIADIAESAEPIGPIAGDAVESYFAFKNGVSGFFTSRRDQPGSGQHFALEIIGSEGVLSLRSGTGNEAMIYPHPVFRPADGEQRWVQLDEVVDEPLSAGNGLAIADLIGAMEEDREPLSSARDAVAALEMILGAYEAQIKGGRVLMPMQRLHPLIAWKEGFYGG